MYKKTMKRMTLLWSLLCFALMLQAQAPAGYYNKAKGMHGKSLKTALYSIISAHKALSYDYLWTAYQTTDVRPDGTIWDMYSNSTKYVPGSKSQGASASKEGDGYNREHSMPKSWFSKASPMVTDLMHVIPTDVYVNGRRSNYPYGETKGERYSSKDGFSKLGSCTLPGYSGIVFEPADEYKGDIARIYFYMATCYENRIASWDSPMLAKNAYPAYTDWALTMLLRWAQEDPVSQKEIDRNNAVYKQQGNRNPYVDYPGLEQYVWGSKTTTAFDPDNYGGGTVDPTPDPKPEPGEVVAPTFSPASGIVEKGSMVTISTTTEGATIYYTIDGGVLQTSYMTAMVQIDGACTIKAYAMLGEKKSEEVTASYVLPSQPISGENVYTLVTDESQLQTGKNYLMVCPAKSLAMSSNASNANFRTGIAVDVNTDNTIQTDVNTSDTPVSIVLGGEKGAWTLYDAVNKKYLAVQSDKNQLNSADNVSANAQWTIAVSADGEATINNVAFSKRAIRYNSSATRFSTYTQGQNSVELYGQATATDIQFIEKQNAGHVTVFDVNGRYVRTATSVKEALQHLPAGVYIVNGQKMMVK